jgi:hypothetical protein
LALAGATTIPAEYGCSEQESHDYLELADTYLHTGQHNDNVDAGDVYGAAGGDVDEATLRNHEVFVCFVCFCFCFLTIYVVLCGVYDVLG